MIFRYRSPVGTFVIAPRERGVFELLFGDETLESFHSPREAALKVLERETGCPAWDSFDAEAAVPENLEDWECWHLRGH